MLFNTHERTPKVKTNKPLKIMLIGAFAFLYVFFIFIAIVTSVIAESIAPALIILIPILVITLFVFVTSFDMKRAYVKIDGDNIKVVDFYFFVKREHNFSINDIKHAEILNAQSLKIRGYRYAVGGLYKYIVFRGENNKYLFKIVCYPETQDFWGNYVEFDNIT